MTESSESKKKGNSWFFWDGRIGPTFIIGILVLEGTLLAGYYTTTRNFSDAITAVRELSDGIGNKLESETMIRSDESLATRATLQSLSTGLSKLIDQVHILSQTWSQTNLTQQTTIQKLIDDIKLESTLRTNELAESRKALETLSSQVTSIELQLGTPKTVIERR